MNQTSIQNQQGLTLVELMVALSLSTLVLAGLYSLFLTTRQSQATNAYLNRIGENARFFTNFVSRDLRMAGYENDDCHLGSPGLAWDATNQTMTIRYCRHASPQTVRYRFGSNTGVDYSSGGHFGPLVDDLSLRDISFGEYSDQGIRYRHNALPDFDRTRTVRMSFELRGDQSAAATSTDHLVSFIEYTVAIRNHLDNAVAPAD